MKKVSILILFGLLLFLAGCQAKTTTSITTTQETTKTTTEETVVVDYTLLNPSFENDIDRILDYSWDTFQSDTMYQRTEAFQSEGSSSLKSTSLFGGFLSVWQVIPIEGEAYRNNFDNQFASLTELALEANTTLPKIGDKVELSVDIFIDETTAIDNTTPFLVYVESEDINGKKTIIAESDVLEVNQNEWFTLTTQPAANNGIIPEDAVLVVISFQINIPEDGIIYLDNANFGKRVKEDEIKTNDNPSYSSLGYTFDIPNNSFEGNSPFLETIEYSNDAYYESNSGIIQANTSQSLELMMDEFVSLETLSTGVWMKKVANTGTASLKLEAYYDDTYHLVNEQILSENAVWHFVKTDMLQTLKDQTVEKIMITITNDTDNVLFVDYLQAGDFQAFNGNPEKLALIAYQPWYASSSEGWGNWQYTDASDFDGGVNSYPARFRDGLRDIASVYYPLIGVYDSSDREVITYHLTLIKAMNIDVVQVNYYANLSQNMLDALAIIFEVASELDLKVSILYEPKIHVNGWIPHATRMEAILAIEQDIKDFIDRYGSSKALLKIDDAPVIEIFGVNIIRNTEWKLILNNILESGHEPYLMGDYIQNSDYSSMRGMVQWDLYNTQLADATLLEVSDHIQSINQITLNWAANNLGYNIPIGLVYPGFDDTKVLGWDLGVARKINVSGPDFYQTSWDTFNDMNGFNWVLVATFNDWNEGTIIEPELTMGHAMAIITQKEVAEFKGTGTVDSDLLIQITNEYLNSRQNQYD